MSKTTLIQGDARRLPLADHSVHCVVTSPPYWGLRDYGTGRWEGGDEGCDHLTPLERTRNLGRDRVASGGTFHDSPDIRASLQVSYRDLCGKCGARRVNRQIGLESTPAEFVATMVEVFREVRRVLRDDGTCWVNLGDSYASIPPGNTRPRVEHGDGWGVMHPYSERQGEERAKKRNTIVDGLKPKDLCGIPWRVALALQADGWYLRSDIIWSKPNPMPESVTDRPTKSHEYLFLLSKAERYFYDAEAVREPHTIARPSDGRRFLVQHDPDRYRGRDYKEDASVKGRSSCFQGPANPAGRNLRSVWSIPTEAYPGSHFATFPRKLVEPCIRAGTSAKGCCPACGAGWVREVDTVVDEGRERRRGMARGWQGLPGRDTEGGQNGISNFNGQTYRRTAITLGWRPGCDCDAGDPVPAVVLDPFAGSGTTLVVAEALGRSAIGIDLSADYLQLARRRIERPHAPVQRPEREEILPLFA